MKLSLRCTLLAGFLISRVMADIDFFAKPAEGASFTMGSTVEFLVDKMPEDDEIIIYAKLFRHDAPKAKSSAAGEAAGSDGDSDGDSSGGDDDSEDSSDANTVYVETVRSWLGSSIGDGNSDFRFSWIAQNVTAGQYHVQLETNPYKKGKPVKEASDDQDDLPRSHTFIITAHQQQPSPPSSSTDQVHQEPTNIAMSPPCMSALMSPKVTQPVEHAAVTTQRKTKRRSRTRQRL